MTMLIVNCHEIRKVRAALTLTQCVLLHQLLDLWGGEAVFISDFVSNILCLNSYIALFVLSAQGLRVV